MDKNTPNPVIDMMEEQKQVHQLGGTMRLGSFPCHIEEDTLAYEIYERPDISERHRHRWEFNNRYEQSYREAGMVLSGRNQETNLVEIIELPQHPFFIGVQFHPELKSTVENPAPLFVHFIKAARLFMEKRPNGRSAPRQHNEISKIITSLQ
jgi:CTP synthase